MSRPTTQLTSTSHTGTETDIADVPSRTRLGLEGLYEMMIAIINELKNINKRCDKNHEELLTRMKEQEEQNKSNAISFKEDIQLLAQQITKLECKLREKDAEIIRHDSLQALPLIYQPNAAVQREIINRPDILSLENDVPAELTRGRVLTLRETLFAIPISDGYNVHIIKFITECRGIQNAILPHEEASVVAYLRSKLRGEARKALHQQQFASIEQFLNRLKKSFGIVGDIYNSHAELKKLCMRNQEKLVNYIDRAQTVYNLIIEAEKTSRGPLTDAEITKLNKRFTHAFYCGLRDNIRSIIEKRNDLSPSEMYEMAEMADQELKARRESQYLFTQTSARRVHCPSPARPQRGEWMNERNDHHRQDSCEQYNNVPRESSSRSSESTGIGNERNLKQRRYCKNIGHEIEKCRKRQYNNSRNNSSGNSRNGQRTDLERIRPGYVR